MEKNKHEKERHWNGRVMLFAIMVGFCVLALIEIVYGQAKLKVEKERLALEETNYQTLQALEKTQEDIHSEETAFKGKEPEQNSSFMNVVEKNIKVTESVEEAANPEENDAEDDGEYDMQIVFLGDSIFDSDRGDDGIAELVGYACNAKVYNMAMGGTTAALLPDQPEDFNDWDSRGLLGVVYAILGYIDTTLFENYEAGQILKECDFSKTDYFVIEYGINDFLAKIPISQYLENGEMRNEDPAHTYASALDRGLNALHIAFPNAKIIVISPHYCQFFDGEKYLGDGYSIDYGYGNLISYARVCEYIAVHRKEDGVIFYNAFEDSGIDAYSAEDCLEDGIHLTSEGRHRYADFITRVIMRDFYPEE